jgi:acetyl coenzyme A synthetase (ADP forming)-like protein
MFESFFEPASVAVIGASRTPGKVGHDIVRNLLDGGFRGGIYPVNPKADEVLGLRCYPSVADVEGEVELAVIVIPAKFVLEAVDECARKGTRAVIVITAGFKESGKEGAALERQLLEKCRRAGIRCIGPNCLGIMSPSWKMNASFGATMPRTGNIAFFSQSGALGTAILDVAVGEDIGLSRFISFGNKADVDETDLIEALGEDERTDVILGYVESINDGRKFMQVARRVARRKPVVIFKSGRTSAGARAASSHTGSLAGADSAYAAAFRQCGVIRAENVDEFFNYARAFAARRLPAGPAIAVVTNAGGPGIMMSDALEMAGLRVAEPDDVTLQRLKDVLPPAGSVRNPVDVLGDAGGKLYGKALDILLESPSVDGVIVILTPQKMTEDAATARAIVASSRKHAKPVLACFIGSRMVKNGTDVLRENSIPQYPIPERAAAAMLEMVGYARYKKGPLRAVQRFAVNKNPVHKIIRAYRAKRQYEIGEADAKAILKAYNFTVPRGELATSVEEAVRFAEEVGYPLAMKISSPDILHKSDVGGVRIGLRSVSDVCDAFELMMLRTRRARPEADLRGVMIEEMVAGGREVILGMKKDAQFGPMLMFGLGGIFVEVLKDVTFSLAPVTAGEARRMIERTKTYALLTGVRGERGVDIPAIVESIQRMSQLVMDFGEIEQMDINPLKVGEAGDGATGVDARMVISKG